MFHVSLTTSQRMNMHNNVSINSALADMQQNTDLSFK